MGNAGAIDWQELADHCGYDGPDDPWLRALCALCGTNDDDDGEADYGDPWAFIGDSIESLGWSDVASLVALIANHEAVPEYREALVGVLTRGATGSGGVVPFGYPAASTLAEAEAIVAGEREPDTGWEADLQRVRQQRFLIRVDAHYDVAEVLPDLLPLLADDDPSVRRGVANLVGCFPEKAEIVLPSLWARLDVETVPGVASSRPSQLPRRPAQTPRAHPGARRPALDLRQTRAQAVAAHPLDPRPGSGQRHRRALR